MKRLTAVLLLVACTATATAVIPGPALSRGLSAERTGLTSAHVGSPYAIGLGPLPFRRPVTVLGLTLVGAKNLRLVDSYAADISGPHAVFPAVAAGNVVTRFPQTGWRPARGTQISAQQGKDIAFVVEVQPETLGEASFTSIDLTYRVRCATCWRIRRVRVPVTALLRVIRTGPDPQAQVRERR